MLCVSLYGEEMEAICVSAATLLNHLRARLVRDLRARGRVGPGESALDPADMPF